MKKRSLFGGLAALAVVGAAAAASIEVIKTNKKMSSYTKKIVFKGNLIAYEDEFESDELAISFSGMQLDFTKATLVNNQGKLTLFAHYSGVDIIVPAHWRVLTEGLNNRSGVSNLCDGVEGDVPTLTIDYDLRFAGLSIRSAPANVDELVGL